MVRDHEMKSTNWIIIFLYFLWFWFSNFPAQSQCQNSTLKNKNNIKITYIIYSVMFKMHNASHVLSTKNYMNFWNLYRMIIWLTWRFCVSNQVYVTLEIHKREVYLYATNSVGFLKSSTKILHHVLLATCNCDCCIQHCY